MPKAGMMDEIRCDEKDYLIWKWRPEGNARRENAIRWGSSLRVRDGSVAVFVYRRKDESSVEEYIEGPFDQTLKTSNLPIIANLVALAYGGGTPFQAEVYFINLARIVQTRFAVRYFDVFDPRFLDFGVPVAVRGTISFRIADYREFISLHRLDEFTLEDFQAQIKDAVSRKIKSIVGALPAQLSIPMQQLEGKTDQVAEIAEEQLRDRLREQFGVEAESIDISAIDVDKTSEGYRQLKAVTLDVDLATIQAQTEANIKNIHDVQRIQAQDLEEKLRIQREESQYATHKQTQSSNMAAYQIEAQTRVGEAAAQALGHMGENGAASVGGDGIGMDMAGLAAGMALGGAVGQNLAATMGAAMSGAAPYDPAGAPRAGAPTPPPVPTQRFYVARDGAATGPFDTVVLRSMASTGELETSTLVWKEGMTDWAAAGNLQELAALFAGPAVPPPIPQQ